MCHVSYLTDIFGGALLKISFTFEPNVPGMLAAVDFVEIFLVIVEFVLALITS
jgi:hypothetical protein